MLHSACSVHFAGLIVGSRVQFSWWREVTMVKVAVLLVLLVLLVQLVPCSLAWDYSCSFCSWGAKALISYHARCQVVVLVVVVEMMV